MEYTEGLKRILDGTALLFVGAGFSHGAINIRDKQFLNGSELAKQLMEKSGITGEVLSLEDAAEAYLDVHGGEALIKEIQNEFTSKVISDVQLQLARYPWKRVYTTNYDDIVEQAFRQNSTAIVPITTSINPYNVVKNQTLCIHLNGYVHRLNLDTLNTELKLAESDYISTSLVGTNWAMTFRHDIKLAKAVFFVGYSLKYDLDIKRILADIPDLTEKCFFILGRTPNVSTIRRAKRYGEARSITTGEFEDNINVLSRDYKPKKQADTTISIKEHFVSDSRVKISDRDFHNLMLFGIRNQSMISESLLTGRRFVLLREKCNDVFQYFDNGHRIITICSALGNGKSLFLDTVRELALQKGYRVFEPLENNDESTTDFDTISRMKGKVLVTIEEYPDWLNEIDDLIVRSSDNIKIITTARNYVHDTHYEDLQVITGIENIPEIFLDVLNDTEINWFIDALQEHGLWGELAARTRLEKRTIIADSCKNQIHALLLRIIESPDIGNRFRALVEQIKTHRMRYKILIGVLIMTLLNQRPNLDTLVDIFGPEDISNSHFRNDSVVIQFLDYTHNEILLKSPIATQYLLQNIADPAFTLSVLKEMAESVDKNAKANKRYRKMIGTFMVFNRIQSLLPKSRGFGPIISYYESIKDLSQCKESPLFWLQYAIPCLLKGDLPSCKSYLDTAYSYALPQNFDTFQIDNWYARYLLEKAIKDLGADEAFENFMGAKNIIHQQMRDEPLRRHPYRVARFYLPFFLKFSKSLDPEDVNEIVLAAKDILDFIKKLPEDRKEKSEVIRCRNAMQTITGNKRWHK